MSDKNNGWKRPEEKYVETELEDNFEAFFAAEEAPEVPKGKRRRKNKDAPADKGPDILAVSETKEDEGFVITEVVAVEGAKNESAEPAKAPEAPADDKKAEEAPASEKAEEEAAPAEGESAEPEKASAEAETPAESEVPAEPEAPAEGEVAEPEKAPAEESAAEPEIVVDLAETEKRAPEKKFKLFPRAKKIINKKRKHRYVAAVGAALIVLALVGSISVVSFLVNFTGRLIENTSQKERFEWKVYPLLMLDPATFDDPNQLDEVFILKTALWSTLLENRSVYSYNENGLLVVPASDLDVAAKKLYGSGVTLKHQTFSEGYEYFYVYDEETNSYSVPISGQTAGYTPKVVKITKNGDIYTLIVGYVAPTTLWNVSAGGGSKESVPDKYLYYDLEKTGGDYIIKAVRAIPADELPEDLEVADYQQINQTQYIDYEQQYKDYLAGLEEQEGEGEPADETSEGETSSGETSSGETQSGEAD